MILYPIILLSRTFTPFTFSYGYDKNIYMADQFFGGVPERFIGAVLKTVVLSKVPWVRIPPPPFLKLST